jgi:selenocysteine-specific translation elongation factor
MDAITVNAVASQGEYAIAEPVFQVMEAYWQTASASSTQLTPMTVESLNAMQQTWRTDPPGTPLYFYLSSNQTSGNSEVIGLYPPPAVSTVAGYPILVMQVSELQPADLGLNDTLLVTLHSSQIYVEGVSYMVAIEIRPQLASAFKASYDQEMVKAKKYVETRNEMVKTPGVVNIRS